MKVAKKNLEEASKPLLTQVSDDPTTSPQHPYTLRGVSTDPDTTYLLYPVVEEDEKTTNLEDNFIDTNKGGSAYEWWKIVYSEMDPKPVVKIVGWRAFHSIFRTNLAGHGRRRYLYCDPFQRL